MSSLCGFTFRTVYFTECPSFPVKPRLFNTHSLSSAATKFGRDAPGNRGWPRRAGCSVFLRAARLVPGSTVPRHSGCCFHDRALDMNEKDNFAPFFLTLFCQIQILCRQDTCDIRTFERLSAYPYDIRISLRADPPRVST
jgi:hypothetical protein